MAIDRPLDQAQAIVASEERHGVPVSRYFGKLASFTLALSEGIAAWKAGEIPKSILKGSGAVKSISEAIGDDHAEYLLRIVVSELQSLYDRFDELSAEHREFLNTDWLSLFVDADRKARQTRTRERVARLAQILCNAAVSEPMSPAEHVEEMLAIAMHLDDVDVAVLREAVRIQRAVISGPTRQSRFNVRKAWQNGNWGELKLERGHFEEICGKLQSLGLLLRLEQPSNHNETASMTADYMLLQRGLNFVDAVTGDKGVKNG